MTQPEHHHDHAHQGHGPAGEDLFSEAFWDQRYGASGALWSGQPNPQLLAEASGLPPGRALDAGSGEGADAIWLAERGWLVTAVDISTVALDRGAAHARQLGSELAERITWQQADLLNWGPQPQTYDLASPAARTVLHRLRCRVRARPVAVDDPGQRGSPSRRARPRRASGRGIRRGSRRPTQLTAISTRGSTALSLRDNADEITERLSAELTA